MESISTISQLPITREYIKNPPRLFSSNFATLQRLSRSRIFPTKSSMSVRNDSSGKGEPVIQKKDAMIIVDHGSRRQESNLMLNDFVAMFKSRTGYQIVEPAHMELAEPAIKDAFRRCVQQGANRVIVSPFFLLPGRHWHQDIPALVAEAAGEYSGTSYIITAPLGLHELMVSSLITDQIQLELDEKKKKTKSNSCTHGAMFKLCSSSMRKINTWGDFFNSIYYLQKGQYCITKRKV